MKIAKKSDKDLPIACVIEKDGHIITEATNSVEKECNALYHAEIVAITSAMKILNTKYLYGCSLYCTLEPCKMCFYAINIARIDNVVFYARTQNQIAQNTQFEYIPNGDVISDLQKFFKQYR